MMRMACVMGCCVVLINLVSLPVLALGPDQVATLPGTQLLEQRVDAVLTACGLPGAIEDHADTKTKRQALRWGDTPMQLSAQAWTLRYARAPIAKGSEAWRHAKVGSAQCLAGKPRARSGFAR